MQINRLIETVYILLRQKSITARELAERFEVSQRTIYRDIDTLSLAGIPIYTEKGKGGGISLLPDFVISKAIFNDQEQNEILSALHGLSSISAPDTSQVLEKLSAVFNKSAAAWLDVDFTDWSITSGDQFSDFKKAILEKRIAEFDYYSTFSEKTHRRIEPIQIWFKSKAWYIKGFCLIRQDMRLFRLSRVKNLKITNEFFTERDLLNLKPNPEKTRVQKSDLDLILKISPEMTYRVYDDFDESLFEKQPDGSFIVTVTWPDDEWVYGHLLSYGEFIEILEPKFIRELVCDKAKALAAKNS